MSLNREQHGFAMIEVMVTAVIIAIGVSGLGVLLMRAIQGTQDSAQQSQAMWIVHDFVGRIRANPEGARMGSYDITGVTDCSTKPDDICAEYFEENAVVPAAVCGATEMADFDKWVTVCGLNDESRSARFYDSPSDFVVNPVLSSTCDLNSARVSTSTGTPDCVQYRVELTWDTRITKGSTDSTMRIQKNDYSLVVEVN